MDRRASSFAALLVLPMLAGCAGTATTMPPAEVLQALVDTRAMDWSEGNWWSYEATVQNVTFDVALIVHDIEEDGFQIGTNLSVGFFGLPWTGNVTGELNPRIGPDEWPLFHFPLEDGKEWRYRLLGYDATTVARAGMFTVPGLGARPGFAMESKAYGQTFARYTYVPEVGWFTRLQLIEPTNGQSVLTAELRSFGPDWQAAYYVEEPVRVVTIDYPTLPGEERVAVPSGFLQLRVGLTAQTPSGIVSAKLLDEKGRTLADAGVLAKGSDFGRATARAQSGSVWTLAHRGAGPGLVHLEITGLAATGPLAQSTRPEWPQFGQTTWMGLPLGS